MRIFILILIFLGWVSSAQAISSFEAKYQIAFGFVDLGEAKMNLEKIHKNRYQLGFFAETSGWTHFVYPYSLQERSQLELLENNVLRTVGYFYEERKNDKVKKRMQAAVDYDKMQVKWTKGKSLSRTLSDPLATDKLSFAFIIGDDIENGRKLRSPITIIDGSKIRTIVVKELTKPPRKNHNSQQETSFSYDDDQDYRRFFLKDDGESMEIWLAKKKRHIPYKILFTSDGWTLHYKLTKIRWK
jgi:hypothetical protein